MILLLISADNWGLHGDGENGEDDLSHTISLQLLDTETGLYTFYISTPATAEYYTLVMVAGCNWGWSIIASCNWTQQETRSDWFSTELGDVFFDTILLWPVWSIKLIQSFIL